VTTFIALLRGINVGGHNRIPMAELRAISAGLGWADVQTYVQSGNLVFRAEDSPESLAAALERAIDHHFGLRIPVLVRPGADWSAYVAGNPFPDASRAEPNRVMLALSRAAPKPGAAGELQQRASNGERIRQVGDALWIHFADGGGNSKLSPALFDRLVGSPVTMRNWRTVLKLAELVSQG
jgi:uncharacterized protein (DUF1697 family)